MKRWTQGVGMVVAAAAATATMAAPASAGTGDGRGLVPVELVCNGQTTTLAVPPGVPAVTGFPVDGGVYVISSVTVTSGGQTVFAKTYGNRNGAGTPVHCTGSLPSGVDVDLVAVPVGPAAHS